MFDYASSKYTYNLTGTLFSGKEGLVSLREHFQRRGKDIETGDEAISLAALSSLASSKRFNLVVNVRESLLYSKYIIALIFKTALRYNKYSLTTSVHDTSKSTISLLKSSVHISLPKFLGRLEVYNISPKSYQSLVFLPVAGLGLGGHGGELVPTYNIPQKYILGYYVHLAAAVFLQDRRLYMRFVHLAPLLGAVGRRVITSRDLDFSSLVDVSLFIPRATGSYGRKVPVTGSYGSGGWSGGWASGSYDQGGQRDEPPPSGGSGGGTGGGGEGGEGGGEREGSDGEGGEEGQDSEESESSEEEEGGAGSELPPVFQESEQETNCMPEPSPMFVVPSRHPEGIFMNLELEIVPEANKHLPHPEPPSSPEETFKPFCKNESFSTEKCSQPEPCSSQSLPSNNDDSGAVDELDSDEPIDAEDRPVFTPSAAVVGIQPNQTVCVSGRFPHQLHQPSALWEEIEKNLCPRPRSPPYKSFHGNKSASMEKCSPHSAPHSEPHSSHPPPSFGSDDSGAEDSVPHPAPQEEGGTEEPRDAQGTPLFQESKQETNCMPEPSPMFVVPSRHTEGILMNLELEIVPKANKHLPRPEPPSSPEETFKTFCKNESFSTEKCSQPEPCSSQSLPSNNDDLGAVDELDLVTGRPRSDSDSQSGCHATEETGSVPSGACRDKVASTLLPFQEKVNQNEDIVRPIVNGEAVDEEEEREGEEEEEEEEEEGGGGDVVRRRENG